MAHAAWRRGCVLPGPSRALRRREGRGAPLTTRNERPPTTHAGGPRGTPDRPSFAFALAQASEAERSPEGIPRVWEGTAQCCGSEPTADRLDACQVLPKRILEGGFVVSRTFGEYSPPECPEYPEYPEYPSVLHACAPETSSAVSTRPFGVTWCHAAPHGLGTSSWGCWARRGTTSSCAVGTAHTASSSRHHSYIPHTATPWYLN